MAAPGVVVTQVVQDDDDQHEDKVASWHQVEGSPTNVFCPLKMLKGML